MNNQQLKQLIKCSYCDENKELDQLRSIKGNEFKSVKYALKTKNRLCNDCISECFNMCLVCYYYKETEKMHELEICEKCFNDQYDGEFN